VTTLGFQAIRAEIELMRARAARWAQQPAPSSSGQSYNDWRRENGGGVYGACVLWPSEPAKPGQVLGVEATRHDGLDCRKLYWKQKESIPFEPLEWESLGKPK
jgi:hypothetical protein